MNVNAYILVGGESRRMGHKAKGLLPYHHLPIIQHIIHAIPPQIPIHLLGTNSAYQSLPYPILADQFPQQGPLAGISTALSHTNTNWNLLLSCDTPLISTQLLQYLIQQIPQSNTQAIIPFHQNRIQPLCALYHQNINPSIQQTLQQQQGSIQKFLSKQSFHQVHIHPQLACYHPNLFFNVNSPSDYQKLLKL